MYGIIYILLSTYVLYTVALLPPASSARLLHAVSKNSKRFFLISGSFYMLDKGRDVIH